ncbi:MAG: protein-methionine-sulfoxide reductase catalytic subunit MsrP [Acetobacteraceae bacterium]|nr:protein-methionine-sulfoxide reductase catalytic subunit MsrP [Acetobacteraceae bacterium]
MQIRIRRGWEIPESRATPEAVVTARRSLLGAGAGLIASAGAAQAQWLKPAWLFGGAPVKEQPRQPREAPRNARYQPGRDVTPEINTTTYNNYYEFGTSKNVVGPAQALVVEPWTIRIEGMVASPRSIGIDDLLKQVTLEERVYRHRCVEAWAMTVPWVGFPLADLLRIAEPQAGAKYVVFQTLADDKMMPGISEGFYPYPYTDGLTMAEAANELAFLSVGMFGKSLPPQNGAPIRVLMPWKYGFKGPKSIVKVIFTDKRPISFWEALQDTEYGFWANVNPAVPHPRWSQARERLLGTDEMVPTQIWNGYGEFVADMYKGLEKERLFA